MKITKIVISTFLFLGLGVNGFCVKVGDYPTVDFGTANYLYETSGFNQIKVPDSGAPNTEGSGYIMNQTGGSAGSVVITDFSWLQILSRVYIETKKTSSYSLSSQNCGQVTISNIHTSNNSDSASQMVGLNSSLSFPIGATLTLDSFTGTSPCYIQGRIPDAITYRVGIGSKTNVYLDIRVQIIPNMAVTHDSAALNFGTICRSTTQQQVLTIAPDGGVSGTYVCPTQNTSADSFTVTGNIGQSFNVNLQNSTTITNGSTNLTVSNLTPSCSSNCQLTANTYNLTVGGTLTVPSGTPTGEYTGNYNLSITY